MQRQQRGVELDRAVLWNGAEGLRHEGDDVSHDAEVDVEIPERGLRLRGGVARKLEDADAAARGCGAQRVWPRAGGGGWDENGSDLVALRDERLEHRPAERLLPDDCDPHHPLLS